MVYAFQYTKDVRLSSVQIRGILETLPSGKVVRKFLGIPYAKVVRFENPHPPTTWPGVRNMTTYGKACYQKIDKVAENNTGLNLSARKLLPLIAPFSDNFYTIIMIFH